MACRDWPLKSEPGAVADLVLLDTCSTLELALTYMAHPLNRTGERKNRMLTLKVHHREA